MAEMTAPGRHQRGRVAEGMTETAEMARGRWRAVVGGICGRELKAASNEHVASEERGERSWPAARRGGSSVEGDIKKV